MRTGGQPGRDGRHGDDARTGPAAARGPDGRDLWRLRGGWCRRVIWMEAVREITRRVLHIGSCVARDGGRMARRASAKATPGMTYQSGLMYFAAVESLAAFAPPSF